MEQQLSLVFLTDDLRPKIYTYNMEEQDRVLNTAIERFAESLKDRKDVNPDDYQCFLAMYKVISTGTRGECPLTNEITPDRNYFSFFLPKGFSIEKDMGIRMVRDDATTMVMPTMCVQLALADCGFLPPMRPPPIEMVTILVEIYVGNARFARSRASVPRGANLAWGLFQSLQNARFLDGAGLESMERVEEEGVTSLVTDLTVPCVQNTYFRIGLQDLPRPRRSHRFLLGRTDRYHAETLDTRGELPADPKQVILLRFRDRPLDLSSVESVPGFLDTWKVVRHELGENQATYWCVSTLPPLREEHLISLRGPKHMASKDFLAAAVRKIRPRPSLDGLSVLRRASSDPGSPDYKSFVKLDLNFAIVSPEYVYHVVIGDVNEIPVVMQ